MNVLLAAPRTDLLLADEEVQDVLGSGLQVATLLGAVTQTELLRKIITGDYDLLWLATHGTAEGIWLSDGILSASLLASLVRGRFDTVFLNTCDSRDTAQMLQNETEASIIATIRSVPDKEAYQTGVLFAHWLKITGDVGIAYHNSKPGNNQTYIYLAGSKKK